MTGIIAEGIEKTFVKDEKPMKVLDGISLSLEGNEFVSVVGPSGCGKSTLLRILAGIIPADSGTIERTGGISYLQQSGSLMPWRNLYQNASLPLEIRTGKKTGFEDKVGMLIEEFGLAGFERHMPSEISGGMARRTALMRTYLEEKEIMLLDEPFSSLDTITRKQMQHWLLKVWNNHRKGVVFVTHDIEEALLLSDKVYILGNRPASVIESVRPDFIRPRDNDIVYSEKFIDMKKSIEKMLLDGN
ncbi:MAG: ABC transporter ATP-binding protein [Clostridia bacterium]|nr:ABC transporter ATP-binding protein [Clostridia bacterium]